MVVFKLAQKYRVFISAVLAGVLIYLARPSVISILAGIPLVLLGEGLRTWSSGHIRKNKLLATDGPYGFTRNPLYFGSFVIGTGFGVMANSLVVIAMFFAAFFLIYWGVIRSEEWDLEQTFGDRFKAYIEVVPRFFPRLISVSKDTGLFDWNLVWSHHEYKAWVGILGAIGFLFFKMKWMTG